MSDRGEGGAQIIGALFLIVFSLTFPLMFITLCVVSFTLTFALHAPEFAIWAGLAFAAGQYALTNIWAALALAAFVLAAVPLACVAFKERGVTLSEIIGVWVMVIILGGFTGWLYSAWPDNASGWQAWIFAFLLLFAWMATFEAGFGTLKLVLQYRANRPLPPPIGQQPHGATKEPETI
jgi:hypothetical protein